MRGACARHLRDLETAHERGFVFDRAKAKRALDFFPEVLRLNGGEFEGVPFELGAWQKFIIGSIFGWVRIDDGMRRFRTAYIEIGKGNGKALALDTPIPTPSGWSTMGALAVGDRVFDETGRPCRVTGATEVMLGRPCYRVKFSDGAEIVADAEHLWATSALRTGGRRGPKAATLPRKGGEALRTTAEIAASLRTRQGWNHRVAIAGALMLPEADLPIPPYTLGAWLGDGDSDAARLTMATADVGIAEAIRAEGVTVERQGAVDGSAGRYLLGRGHLQRQLRELALLGEKHIPAAYLRAGAGQRLELLRGLMDTDGFCSTPQGQSEFTTTSARLKEDVLELLRSLGFKVGCCAGRATLEGRDCGPKWRLTFTAPADLPVFRLQRKAGRQRSAPNTRPLSRGRMIVACDRVDSVPVRCISVDSPRHMYLAGEHMVPTHNSPLAAGVGLYCLCADDESRAEVFAAATKKDQAMILFRDAVAMVDQSPALAVRLAKTGGANCYNLAYREKGSFFRAISSDDGQSGPRPHCTLIDEVHEHPNANVITMLAAGQKGRRQPLQLEITNSGFDRHSICFEHHEYSGRVCDGTQDDDQWFAYVCGIDEGDDPLDPKRGEACWIKANPNLGVSIKRDYLQKQVREARGMPSLASKVRRLNFCEWVDAESPWISGSVWLSGQREFDAVDVLAGADEVVGAFDLSGTSDLTALALAGRVEGRIVARVEFWTPGDTAEDRSKRDKVPYPTWIRQGFLQATPGRAVDYGFVAQRIAELQTRMPLRRAAFDPYRIKYLEKDLDEAGVELQLIEHPQGYYKPAEKKDDNGDPLPVLWMPRSIELLQKCLFDEAIDVEWNPVLNFNSASAVLEPDPKNNLIFTKRKSRGRIDGVVALAMCVGLLLEDATADAAGDLQVFFV